MLKWEVCVWTLSPNNWSAVLVHPAPFRSGSCDHSGVKSSAKTHDKSLYCGTVSCRRSEFMWLVSLVMCFTPALSTPLYFCLSFTSPTPPTFTLCLYTFGLFLPPAVFYTTLPQTGSEILHCVVVTCKIMHCFILFIIECFCEYFTVLQLNTCGPLICRDVGWCQ